MSAYSFLDITCAIIGPGGNINLGSDAGGVAEEGIDIEMDDDKNTMTTGADGGGMHSLHAGKSGMITIRLLKTSPMNERLQSLYSFQTSSSAFHGRNTITVSDRARGDICVASECAFNKFPKIAYSKVGDVLEWTFACIRINNKLGSGNPAK